MKQFLFICTGNTCRSPMAEALFNQRAKALGLDVRASSAGIMAAGEPMSEGARRALQGRGLDGSAHRSRQVSRAMLKEVDFVLCMTASQTQAVEALESGVPISLLADRDIADPYGGPLQAYELALGQIEAGLDKLFDKLSAQA